MSNQKVPKRFLPNEEQTPLARTVLLETGGEAGYSRKNGGLDAGIGTSQVFGKHAMNIALGLQLHGNSKPDPVLISHMQSSYSCSKRSTWLLTCRCESVSGSSDLGLQAHDISHPRTSGLDVGLERQRMAGEARRERIHVQRRRAGACSDVERPPVQASASTQQLLWYKAHMIRVKTMKRDRSAICCAKRCLSPRSG